MTSRSLTALLPLPLLVAAGSLLPSQFAINSALAGQTHSVVLAAAISYGVGLPLLMLLLAASRQKPNWAAGKSAPPWAWLAGVIGSSYVVGSVVLTQQIGAALATTLVIAAQLITAIAMDHFGVLGLPTRPVNRLRAAAVALTLAGLGLRFWGLK
ncbi:DMT family transporter [Deinococcus sp.]|uniref:DMT family transporter n=1 Tax=Deinococcus sp. TaxID=47478 RepID=UPI0025B9B592|nr:DMT family transporter [Deinococcus sp.]